MNYISPVDTLNIKTDELLTLSEASIIRLEKSITAKLRMNTGENALNEDDLNTLLAALRNEDARKAIYCIEKHPWLKELILNKQLPPGKSFEIDETISAQTTDLNKHLESYLLNSFIPVFKKALNEEQFYPLASIIEKRELFSDELTLSLQELFHNKLEQIIAVLASDFNKKTFQPIGFIKNYAFVKLLNAFPPYTVEDQKYDLVNGVVAAQSKIERFNKRLYCQILVTFGHITCQNANLKEVIYHNHLVGTKALKSKNRRRLFRIIFFGIFGIQFAAVIIGVIYVLISKLISALF